MAIYSLSHKAIGRATHDPGTAGAHVRYITRQSAARLVLAERMPEAPHQARAWLDDQEQAERKNGRVIDKVMVALPRELTPEQRAALVREFAGEVTQGRAPWLAAIHDQGKDAANPHAHIVIRDKDPETRRRVAGLNDMGRKQRDGSKTQSGTERLRAAWEQAANRALERAGHEARIDRRSLAAQGIERTAQVHVGPRAKAMEGRGVRPSSQIRRDHRGRMVRYPEIDTSIVHGQQTRAEHNRRIVARNEQRLRQRQAQEQARLAREAARREEEAALLVAAEEQARKRAQEAEDARKAREARKAQEEAQRAQVALERAAAERYEGLVRAHQEAAKAAAGVVWQRHQWTEAHPWRARLHRLGVVKAAPLAEIEGREAAAEAAKKALEADTEGRRAYEAREAARAAPEAAQREAERQERAQQRKEAQAQRREKAQQKGPSRGRNRTRDRGGPDFSM
jgi:hypothetical protein